jgi:drug/metabolite transporter superfamily protein YnfA
MGGILGGVTMFVWLFVAHEFLPLGELGVKEIPDEAPVISAMQSAIPQAGLYLFPGFGLGPNPTLQQRNAAMPAYMKKYEQSPHGILVYHPASGAFNFGAALAREGALNLLEGLLAAWLLSYAAAGRAYSARAGLVVILGVLASVTTNLEYWNWYDFPGNYVAGYMVTQIIGFTMVGLVVAAFVKSEIAVRS